MYCSPCTMIITISILFVSDCEFTEEPESSDDDEEPSFTWRLEEPLTKCKGDSPDSPLRLTFSAEYIYIKEDQTWLEDFIRSVDRLTETQALIFGPTFATLFVILKIVGNSIVGKHMSVLCTKLKESVASLPEVAEQLANLDVKMPPPDKLKKLLQVYVDVKLPPIFLNTALGGLLHTNYRYTIPIESVNRLVLDFLRMELPYYRLELVDAYLNLVGFTASAYHGPRRAYAYFAFLQQCLPESWKAISRLTEKCTTVFDIIKLFALQDPLWKFAGAFSDTVFDELSFDRNHQACNISTVVYDLLIDRSVRDWPVLGPSYRSLIREKPKWMRISRRDAILAENLSRVLRMEIGEQNPEERVVTGVNEDADFLVSAPKELVQERFPQMLGDIDARKKGVSDCLLN